MKKLGILILWGLLGMAGLTLAVTPQVMPQEDARQQYELAFTHLVEGRYAQAYEEFRTLIERYPDTPYARRAAFHQTSLEQLDLPTIRRQRLDQSGRIDSIVFGTLYTTWLGIGTARLVNAQDGQKTVAAGMMLGAPLGLFGTMMLTANAQLGRGRASLINFAGYWGSWQGLGWSILADEDEDEKTLIASTMAGGLVGLATTSLLTRGREVSLGDAALIHYGGLWGTWFSTCAAMVVWGDRLDGDMFLRTVLIGGNLGAATMALMTPHLEVRASRATLVNLGGILGTVTSLGALLLLDVENTRVAFGTLMVGGIVGLHLASRFTQGGT